MRCIECVYAFIVDTSLFFLDLYACIGLFVYSLMFLCLCFISHGNVDLFYRIIPMVSCSCCCSMINY